MENLDQSYDVVEGIPARVGYAVCDIADRLSATSLGQFALRKTNRALWAIEKCMEWFIPRPPGTLDDSGNQSKLGNSSELIRPLPWIIFLPTIILFRIFHILLFFGAAAIGKDPITPEIIVKFLQNRRRRLRAVKFNGLRLIRLRNQAVAKAAKLGLLSSFKFSVYSLLCLQRQDDIQSVPLSRSSPTPAKRKHQQIDQSEQEEEYDLTEILQMSNILSDTDDVADPDYEVGDESSTTSDSSEYRTDDEEDHLNESKVSSHGSISDQVIAEETEKEVNKEDEHQKKKEEEDIKNHVAEINELNKVDDLKMIQIENKGAEQIEPHSHSPPPLPVKKPVDTKTKVSPKIDLANFINAEQHGGEVVVKETCPSSDEQYYSPLSSNCTSPLPNECFFEQANNSVKLIESEKTPTNERKFNFEVTQPSSAESTDHQLNSSGSANLHQNSNNDTDAQQAGHHQNHHTKTPKKGQQKHSQKNHKHSPKLNHFNKK